jgi:hypothetical protein
MGSNDSILNLIGFIKENKDWEESLSKPPYCLKVKRHPKLYELTMFSYNQFESDFNNPIVRVCRGSVLWIDHYKEFILPITVPFYKFANFNESYADRIDWNNCQVQKKFDGSLIKLSRHNNMNPRLIWTTNNSFDIDAEIPDCIPFYDEEKSRGCKTFHQLLNVALGENRGWIENIPDGCTLMFELISPRNRIIVPYKETELILLGGRNGANEEISPSVIKQAVNCPLRIPDIFPFNSLEQVMNYCDSIQTTDNEEGVVVCDKNYNRIKVKCASYKALKFIKGEDHFSDKGIFEAIKDNSIDDAVSAWPEIKNRYEEILQEYKDLQELIKTLYVVIKAKYISCSTRKEYAKWVLEQDPVIQGLLFECTRDVPDFSKIISKLEYKEMTGYLSHLQVFFLEY